MAFGQVGQNTTNNITVGDSWQDTVGSMKAQCGTQAAEGADLNQEIGNLLTATGNLLQSVANLLGQQESKPPSACQPAPVQPPKPENSCHPSGSLKTDGKVITTPGGYKIEATAQYEWKITGPDGKSTRVWGDPHVDEGDGGKWDFKRDSTFVLGDGTRINCKTGPYNDMTITKELEIISGNDRVIVSDIDKGKGKIGQITPDGFANVNSFGGKDVFVMGRETDDWSFTGKEIIGSNNGGDSFKLGKELAPLVQQTNNFGGPMQWAGQLLQALGNMLNTLSNMQSETPARETVRNCWDPRAQGKRTSEDLSSSLNNIAGIFSALSQIINLSSQLSLGRFNQNLN